MRLLCHDTLQRLSASCRALLLFIFCAPRSTRFGRLFGPDQAWSRLWAVISIASFGLVRPPSDPPIRNLQRSSISLMQNFRARRYDSVASLARLVFSRDPNEPAARRLLALAGGWLLEGDNGLARSPEYHRAQSAAYEILGERKLAAVHRRRIPAAKIKRRLKPIALAVLDLVSSTRHPIDQAARQQTRLRLQQKLVRSINRLRRPS